MPSGPVGGSQSWRFWRVLNESFDAMWSLLGLVH